MKSTLFLFVTVFSCTFIWRIVTSQNDDCGVDSCYGDLLNIRFHADQNGWEQICRIVETTADTCLDSVIGNQGCSDYRDFARAEFPHLCSLPLEDVSASFQCYSSLSTNDMLLSPQCKAELAPYENVTSGVTFDACQYYTIILRCYNESLTSHCPDHVAPVLHHFTSYYDYTSRSRLSTPCPAFEQQTPTEAPESCETQLQSCYNNFDFLALFDDMVPVTQREALFEDFCEVVRNSGACLDRISGDQSCESHVDLNRYSYELACSRSFIELLDFERCVDSFTVYDSSSIPTCESLDIYDGGIGTNRSEVCRYYTDYLTCLNDTIDLVCDRSRDVTKHYISFTYTVSARHLLDDDCPLLDIIPDRDSDDDFDNGSSALSTSLNWIVTTIVAIVTVLRIK